MLDNPSKNIWEIESQFKCPIVGAMLTVEKHKQILKKCGYDVNKMKPYEFHQQLMSRLHGRNNVSVKVNNFIRSQAAKHMKKIDGLEEKQIRILWKEQLENGHAGPMMYAIIAHKSTGSELLQDIYGEIHMQAHANMKEIFNVRKKGLIMNEALAMEKKKVISKNQKIKILMDAKKADARKNSLLEAENRSLVQLVSRIKNTQEKVNHGKSLSSHEQKIADLNAKLLSSENQLRIKERGKRALQIQLFESKDENRFLKEGFQALSENFASLPPLNCTEGSNCSDCFGESCPQYQLCAKRVFMIGGITKMKSFYKDIVENAGGKFDYHDGYLKNGHTNLEARVKRCDVVLCPVNCNSHNACLKVKKFCNRYQKPLKFLGSSSLSAVSRAIFLPQDRSGIGLDTQSVQPSH